MINEKALLEAASKLAKLRMTEVFGRKEIPCLTVKSVLQKGLGCLYDNAAIVYVLRAGIRYYLKAAEHQLQSDGATPEGFCECGTSLEHHAGMYCSFRPAAEPNR